MEDVPPNTTGYDACVSQDRYIGGFATAGLGWVGRYIAPGTANAWKVVTPEESVALAIAGVKLMPIFESTAQRSLDGGAAGAADGQFALSCLPTVGLMPNDGVVLEGTTDFDPPPSAYPAIVAYYTALAAALAPSYGVGAYAGGAVLGALAGAIKVRWLTQSMGFAGTEAAIAAGDYDIIQRLPENFTVNGAAINVDLDSLRVPGFDFGARVPWDGAVPEGAPFNSASIQMLLNKAGQTPPLGVDDVSGQGTKAALAAWLAKGGFSALDWNGATQALLQAAGVPIFGSKPTAVAKAGGKSLWQELTSLI
jgi:hypothetical protein